MTKSVKRTLVVAGVLLVISLTPSVSDMVEAHQNDLPHKNLLWAWVAGAVVVAVVYGEVALGLKRPGK